LQPATRKIRAANTGWLDRYLGATGYKSQQIPDEPRNPEAPNNLYDYVPGVHSARGKFSDRSSRTSAEVFFTLHRHWFAVGAWALLGTGATLFACRRNA
jgi:hypothetical protein